MRKQIGKQNKQYLHTISRNKGYALGHGLLAHGVRGETFGYMRRRQVRKPQAAAGMAGGRALPVRHIIIEKQDVPGKGNRPVFYSLMRVSLV